MSFLASMYGIDHRYSTRLRYRLPSEDQSRDAFRSLQGFTAGISWVAFALIDAYLFMLFLFLLSHNFEPSV